MHMLITIAGYVGSVSIVVAFYMVSQRKWAPTSTAYLLTNFIGSGLLALYQLQLHAYAGVALNIIFAAVSVLAFAKRNAR